MTLTFITVGVARKFSDNSDAKPYVAVRVGPYYGSLHAPPVRSGSRWGWNANVTVGVELGDRYSLEVRYDCFDRLEGLDPGGLELMVGFRLFELRL